jgi:hypothetical protein
MSNEQVAPETRVPRWPGCWSQGATQPEALESIRDTIREHLGAVDEQLAGEEIRAVEVTVLGQERCHEERLLHLRCSEVHGFV